MCGRYTLHTESEIVASRFKVDLEALTDLTPRYNIAPTQPVLTFHHEDDARVASQMRWGLVPAWAEDRSKLPSMINARVETIAEKPAYRSSFRHRRCLIPADGFYEWQRPQAHGGPKTPHWISLRDGSPFAMAGLWAEWRSKKNPDAEPLRSCTIVTAPANAALAPIHTRMPVILKPEAEDSWLDPALDAYKQRLLALLVPISADALKFHPVSRRVNSPRNNDPGLLSPADDPSLGF